MATRRRFESGVQGQADTSVTDPGRSIAEVVSVSASRDDVRQTGEESERQSRGPGPVRDQMWSSGNGSARATPSCRWSVISQKSDDLVREGTALKLRWPPRSTPAALPPVAGQRALPAETDRRPGSLVGSLWGDVVAGAGHGLNRCRAAVAAQGGAVRLRW